MKAIRRKALLLGRLSSGQDILPVTPNRDLPSDILTSRTNPEDVPLGAITRPLLSGAIGHVHMCVCKALVDAWLDHGLFHRAIAKWSCRESAAKVSSCRLVQDTAVITSFINMW